MAATEADTFARSAAPPRMAPLVARPTPPWPLVSPLRLDRWIYHLDRFGIRSSHLPLLDGIEFGFSYHSSIQISETRIYPNHPSAINNPDAVDQAIATELAAGRYFGPFSPTDLENLIGPFICHPLGVVAKSNGKMRLVEDLSYPRNSSNPSLNSLTDISNLSLDWGGFAEAATLVITAKPGALGATIDWKDAFRNCAVRRDELWLGCICWKGQTYVDNSLKFGGSACPFGFELVAAAFVALCHCYDLGTLIHWVDDILSRLEPTNAKPPWSYPFTLDQICQLGADLGGSFPPEKVSPYSSVSKYFGFLWFWDLKKVGIPNDRRLKVLSDVLSILELGKASLDSLRSLSGKLSHLSCVLIMGRSKLRHIWDRLAAMTAKCRVTSITWALGEGQRNELLWWRNQLSSPDITLQLCTEKEPDDSLRLFSDASESWGICIVIGDEFDCFKLSDNWRESHNGRRDIGWAEFAAVEILVNAVLASKRPSAFHNRHFSINCDNQGVIGAWVKRSSRNHDQNEVLGRILFLMLKNQCFLSFKFVDSASNPADGPSRGLDAPGARRRSFRGFPRNLAGLVHRA